MQVTFDDVSGKQWIAKKNFVRLSTVPAALKQKRPPPRADPTAAAADTSTPRGGGGADDEFCVPCTPEKPDKKKLRGAGLPKDADHVTDKDLTREDGSKMDWFRKHQGK
eukprot:gene35567-32800_t